MAKTNAQTSVLTPSPLGAKAPPNPLGDYATPYDLGYWVPKLPLRPARRQLVLALAGLSYGGKLVTAAVSTIARSAGVSDRTVQLALQDFERRGWVSYKRRSRGLADQPGCRTNAFRINWNAIGETARKADESRRAQQQRQREADAERYANWKENKSRRSPDSDPKGERTAVAEPSPKGEGNARDLSLHLGEASRKAGENSSVEGLINEGAAPLDPEHNGCNWDDEFVGTEGVKFTTALGQVWIPPATAEKWVGWQAVDGERLLQSAHAYMARRGILAPNKLRLVPFLADYCRKRAHGYDDQRHDAVYASLFSSWSAD